MSAIFDGVIMVNKSKTRIYRIWCKMKNRCLNQNSECDKVIKYLYSQGYTQARLAKAYGITRTRVRNILEVRHFSHF